MHLHALAAEWNMQEWASFFLMQNTLIFPKTLFDLWFSRNLFGRWGIDLSQSDLDRLLELEYSKACTLSGSLSPPESEQNRCYLPITTSRFTHTCKQSLYNLCVHEQPCHSPSNQTNIFMLNYMKIFLSVYEPAARLWATAKAFSLVSTWDCQSMLVTSTMPPLSSSYTVLSKELQSVL